MQYPADISINVKNPEVFMNLKVAAQNQVKHVKLRYSIISYFGITIGAIIMAFSLILFIKANRIVPGGVMGLANIVNYITGFPIGLKPCALALLYYLLEFLI
jgi:uncharacterized membrane-anchored protein YitT (DUF2179 family)